MRTASSTIAGRANAAPAKAFGQNESPFGVSAAIVQLCREFWPAKTAAEVASRTGVSVRQAEFWLAGRYEMSLAAARRLLRSEHGFDFLHALMGESDAAWWWQVKHHHEVAVTNRAIKAAERKLAKLRAARDQVELDL